MTTEFNLSKKVAHVRGDLNREAFYWEEDVQEFIRLLKEELQYASTKTEDGKTSFFTQNWIIDKLAGSKLSEGAKG